MHEKYTGTWDSINGFPDGIIPGTFPGTIPNVFTINSDGSGKILLLGNIISCVYRYSETSDGDKITLLLPGTGECTFNVEIFNDNLYLSNASADSAGIATGLPIYALLSPFAKVK